MNEKTKKALISLLNEEVTVASWGITNLAIKDTCFEFFVFRACSIKGKSL